MSATLYKRLIRRSIMKKSFKTAMILITIIFAVIYTYLTFFRVDISDYSNRYDIKNVKVILWWFSIKINFILYYISFNNSIYSDEDIKNEYDAIERKYNEIANRIENRNIKNILLTVCGDNVISETVEAVKSAITFSKSRINFIVFIDNVIIKLFLTSLVCI